MTLRLWQDRAPNNAVVAQSVVALVTRQGNPKRIQDWHDLTRSALISSSQPACCTPASSLLYNDALSDGRSLPVGC